MTAIGHVGHAPSATTGVGGASPPVQRVEFPVVGLTCGACVQAVEHAIRAVPGVFGATVNLTQGRAFVEYDPAQTTVAALHDAIKTAGYRSETSTARFRIEGITCASCVAKIETALHETPGVLAATVSVGSEEAVVEYVPSVTDLPTVKTAVGSAGYRVVETMAPAAPSALDRETEARAREYRTLMRQWWFGAGVGVFTMVLSYP
ncbi:MAG TPA: copper ion binding protein, partial [Methylomirabilota bacterium]|nr:copper ion binding protein [Methylomirabilota bacterium]